MLIIKASTVLTPERELQDAAVVIERGIIAAVGPADAVPQHAGAQVIDAPGLILAPGFIDLQVNGASGHDFTADPASIWAVAARLPRYGVTSFLPTIITSPPEKAAQAQQVVREGRPRGFAGAQPLGLHLEGPFLNPARKGAHNPAYLRQPDLESTAHWSPEEGVRLVTLAPELPDALTLAETLAARGVVVSAGHSDATFLQALAGFGSGIRYGTHLFNAMASLLHREPGLPAALLADPRATVGLIADGIHVHPAMVRLAWQVLGPRLNLVTDAMAALGMPPGRHLLGDFLVTVDGESCRLADGTLAGSILSLDQAVRNLVAFAGCSLAEAVGAVTVTPARLLGLEKIRGRIAVGQAADLVLLTPRNRVHATIVGGQLVYVGRRKASVAPSQDTQPPTSLDLEDPTGQERWEER